MEERRIVGLALNGGPFSMEGVRWHFSGTGLSLGLCDEKTAGALAGSLPGGVCCGISRAMPESRAAEALAEAEANLLDRFTDPDEQFFRRRSDRPDRIAAHAEWIVSLMGGGQQGTAVAEATLSLFRRLRLGMRDAQLLWSLLAAQAWRFPPLEEIRPMTAGELFARFGTLEAMAGFLEEAMHRLGYENTATAEGRFRLMLRYMESHPEEELRLGDLCGRFLISESYAGMLFGRVCGCGFSRYLTGLRMARARQLLRETGLTVRETAERCGYADAFYFSKVFRRENGISPGRYRDGTD